MRPAIPTFEAYKESTRRQLGAEVDALTNQQWWESYARAYPDAVSPNVNPVAGAAPVVATPPPAFEERRYRSSRWTRGNFFFPDSMTLAADGIHFRKARFFGSSEEHISYRSVASIRIRNGLIWSEMTIETSGGSQPIFFNGIGKRKAREIQDTIRAFQQQTL